MRVEYRGVLSFKYLALTHMAGVGGPALQCNRKDPIIYLCYDTVDCLGQAHSKLRAPLKSRAHFTNLSAQHVAIMVRE